MTLSTRPLSGLRVGLSVSGGEELALKGFTESGLNRLTVRFSRALLAEGASLAFGHDWREGGVMEAVASIALDYQGPSGDSESGPPIVNVIPWPEKASATDSSLLSKLKGIVEVIPAGLPQELQLLEAAARRKGRSSEEWRYLRARGLTYLRRLLSERCQARVVLGGKLEGFDGRLPGIVEEVFLSAVAGQPVYLAGLLGGAAELLGKLLVANGSAASLRQSLNGAAPSPLAQPYSRHAKPNSDGLADSDLDAEAIMGFLTTKESKARILANGLTGPENLDLLHTTLEEEVVSLTLKGLKQIWNPQARSFRTRASES